MPKVAVLGGTGYLGGELLRLLSTHPSFTLSTVVSKGHPDRPLAELHPNLPPTLDLRTVSDPDQIEADVAFLAQPAGEAMRVVPGLLERGIRVVDLGPDYRLPSAELSRSTYGAVHTDPEHLAEAVYGLPELAADRIRSARLIANPGCYPTATLLALVPLVRAGAIHGPIVIDAKSGTSGSGQALTSATHHPEAALTVQPYGTPDHRHVPEMRAALERLAGSAPPITFVPHLVPVVRGILCSIYPTAGPGEGGWGGWAEALRSAYRESPFVSVGGVPRLTWATGTNRCFLSVQSAGGSPVLFSVLDNLGKGGASQAIQNANLLFGRPAEEGLPLAGFGV